MIMKKKLFFAVVAIGMLASCAENEYVGEVTPNPVTDGTDAIVFNSGAYAITRTEKTGAEAAEALNNAFVVEGTKGSTSVAQTVVFDNYNVNYTANTANTTESNTDNWEYVGLDVNSLATIHHSGDKQTIKYWDYMQPQYDFIAYSLGSGGATATAITPETATTLTIPQGKTVAGAYTISGTTDQLKTAHIADLVTVKDADYGKPVTITFRSLSSKVRMGIYETIPGYSVRDVKFYASATATSSSADNAILYSSGSTLPIKGTYTVYFPHVNITESTAENYSDNNKAHVSFVADATDGTQANQTFGALSKYVVKEKYEDESTGDNASKIYLGRSSNACTYAGTDPYYQDVLPNENNPAALTLKVDYTLVSIDGTKENISVTGATAVVPAIYTKWLPNYAYTYIFKISDNTNGKTNPSKDAVGLHPITFDAVVVEATETDNVQETVTTVATPSITTYQHDPAVNASANDEYKAGDIYVMVMDGGTLKGDLNGVTTTPTKDAAKLYTLSKSATEAEVMDALTMQASVSGNNITGRNGLVLTNVSSLDNTITAIPGPDGNNITVTAGQASKFTASAGMTYAYVYTVTQKSGTDEVRYEAVKPASGTDVTSYYTNTTDNTLATGTADGNTTYYAKYTVNNGQYAVKVIKVASSS